MRKNSKQKFVVNSRVKVVDGPKNIIGKVGKVTDITSYFDYYGNKRCWYKVSIPKTRNNHRQLFSFELKKVR